jgi:acetyltransferase-like isoleucine patch superfamily enzyme
MLSELADILRKALAQPRTAVLFAVASFRGWWLKVYFPLTGRRFRAGERLMVFGRLRVSGPGEVILGSGVEIGMEVTMYTHAPGAQLIIHDRCYLNGTRFGCAERIEVGSGSILGECRILDTNFHSVFRERRDRAAPVTTSRVNIGANVWVCPDAVILPGTTIGANSVIGVLTVCRGSIPSDSIVAGNPAVKVGAVPSLRAERAEGIDQATVPAEL